MAHNVQNSNAKCPKNVNAQMQTSRDMLHEHDGLVEHTVCVCACATADVKIPAEPSAAGAAKRPAD